MAVSAADVVIIGGGIAGAAAAAELSRDRDVVVLEREEHLGSHATGRSAAITSSTSGDPAVCALAQASREFLISPPEGFSDRSILSPRGLLWVANSDHLQLLNEIEDTASQLSVTHRRLSPAEAQRLVPKLSEPWSTNAVYEPDAMTIDVALLLEGFVKVARQRGARFLTRTGTLSGSRRAGVWHLRTAAGELRAPTVVNAAGAWGDQVAVDLGVRPIGLMPFRRSAFTFPVDSVSEWPLVMDVGGSFYFEPEGPGLLASPSEETLCDPHDAQADELAIAKVVDTLQEVLGVTVKGVRAKWAGLRTFAPDRRPVVGFDDDMSGFAWLVGQGGAGIKTAPAMAELLKCELDQTPVPQHLLEVGIHRGQLGISSRKRNQTS